MRRACAALLALLTLAGCAGGPAAGGEAADAASGTLFLLVEESFTVQSGSGRLPGDFGPHCGQAEYSADPPAVTLWGGEAPWGVLLRRFDEQSMRSDRVQRDAGSGLVRHDFGSGSEVELRAAFDAGRVVATVESRGGAVEVDGSPLAEGGSRQVDASYTVQRDGASYLVEERLLVRNLGRVAAALREPLGPCD